MDLCGFGNAYHNYTPTVKRNRDQGARRRNTKKPALGARLFCYVRTAVLTQQPESKSSTISYTMPSVTTGLAGKAFQAALSGKIQLVV
jgi:hypothetical protein